MPNCTAPQRIGDAALPIGFFDFCKKFPYRTPKISRVHNLPFVSLCKLLILPISHHHSTIFFPNCQLFAKIFLLFFAIFSDLTAQSAKISFPYILGRVRIRAGERLPTAPLRRERDRSKAVERAFTAFRPLTRVAGALPWGEPNKTLSGGSPGTSTPTMKMMLLWQMMWASPNDVALRANGGGASEPPPRGEPFEKCFCVQSGTPNSDR